MARKRTNEFGFSLKKLSNDAWFEFDSSLMKLPCDERDWESPHQHGCRVLEKQKSELYYSSTLYQVVFQVLHYDNLIVIHAPTA